MVTNECISCERTFESPRKRKTCSDVCKKRAQRAGAPSGNALEKATLAELERLGKVDSMLGQQALVIARRMGDRAETGSAVATLSREHSRLMAAVAAGVSVADPVDEARASRERKLGRE